MEREKKGIYPSKGLWFLEGLWREDREKSKLTPKKKGDPSTQGI